MKITDHQNSVQEEPFTGDSPAGENKQDSDLSNNTDSNNPPDPEDTTGEEDKHEKAGPDSTEKKKRSPASGRKRATSGDNDTTAVEGVATVQVAGEQSTEVRPPEADTITAGDEHADITIEDSATTDLSAAEEAAGIQPADTLEEQPEPAGEAVTAGAIVTEITDQEPDISTGETSEEIHEETSEEETSEETYGEIPEPVLTDITLPSQDDTNEAVIDPGQDIAESPEILTEEDIIPEVPGEHEPVTVSAEARQAVPEATEFDYSTLSRQDLVNRLQELINSLHVQDIMADVDHIKLNFYKKFKQETEQKRKKFVEDGGNIEDFQVAEDPLENQIKELLKTYRSRKSDYNKNIESVKHDNLKLKYEVIEKIKDLVNRKESINKTFQEFRELQKEWRSIGLVPQSSLKDLWDNYNYHVEKFYDYIKINKELRDLDLKKNLEAKIRICEKAESLLLEPSVLNAFKSLQKFHDQWREIGPVPAEKRSEIWDRFREATYKINKKHQQYFEDLKNTQKKNLEQKKILCEKAEEINHQVLTTQKQWDEKSKELIELQKVWRTIGFAPKKDNNKIYMRFREACDTFFNLKRDYYTQNKEMQLNNLQMKTELCIQAELLRENTDWKKTTDELINLQKKWKEIGPVPKKYSEQIWRRFRAACDWFFEKKSEYFKNIDKTYEVNLQKKDELIREIETFVASDKIEENFKKLNEFQRRWTEIGYVPFGNKEELQERYRIAINNRFDSLKIDENQKNLLKFQNRLDSIMQKPNQGAKLQQEREKCIIRLQQLNSDIVLWENNIGFFAKSKNADSMIRDINNKINNTKATIKLLESKIEMIDNLDTDHSD